MLSEQTLPKTKETVAIELFDVSGKLVLEKQWYSIQNATIDLEQIQNGYYLCLVSVNGESYFTRFAVVR